MSIPNPQWTSEATQNPSGSAETPTVPAPDTTAGATTYTSDYLRLALTLLQTKGWCQDKYHNGNGYCAVGAISNVTPRENYNKAVIYLADAIGIPRSQRGSIPMWNDAYTRSFEDVALAFKQAIDIAEVAGD